MASEFDDSRTVVSQQVPHGPDAQSVLGGSVHPRASDNVRVQSRFREFLRHFRTPDSPLFLYRDQLVQRYNKREFRLEVDLEHLNQYDEVLSELLLKQPDEYLPLFEKGAKEALRQAVEFGEQPEGQLNLPDIQVTLKSSQTPTPMREILANDVNHLLLVPGIIISASKVTSLPTAVVYMCRSCKVDRRKQSKAGLSKPQIERACPSCGVLDQQVVLPDKCEFVDRQFLKLQEAPEVVRTGEMPRHISLYVERYLVDQVAPGARVAVMGVSSVFKQEKGSSAKNNNKRRAYLRVVGIQSLDQGSGRVSSYFTPEEERMFVDMSRDPQIYDKLTRSIAPSISGDYTHDIKKAIACLLFGGSRRVLPDGMKLRGDINVLLLGDPSTAKSQFLKFVEKVAPVGVYTSGKGSSAAGLTASVVKDARGEFYLEGGAMVLADGGVVCIDEFDKMREQDRVAIHEAMEQQTISVAKAGITTILNSRTSVLAAANPVFGTYDDARSAAENIDFLPTILSRFDLIFIVRDVRDESKDMAIARHVLGVHVNFSASDGQATIEEGEVDLVTMKKYISYCRNRCAPVMTQDSSDLLRDHYVGIRESHRNRVLQSGASSATVPITIRQLEAVVRLSEALAKMQLSLEVTPEHVAEATRLFKVSTLSAASAGALPGALGGMTSEQILEVQRVEEQFKRRVAIGSKVQHRAMRDELVLRQGYSAAMVDKALRVMESRSEIQLVNKQRMIHRIR